MCLYTGLVLIKVLINLGLGSINSFTTPLIYAAVSIRKPLVTLDF